ncbi:hypothetical protein PoB_003665000 [Plakobranchus ocellatus]|uniref:Uncharacterized protein n=1 Tax=Plakobranchus ocellatus TaxID=259542 RepID=A0AAV4AS76_9GAST|nr:hypothetical protein PoB_003665000 [Plakobranchus ocellatus]
MKSVPKEEHTGQKYSGEICGRGTQLQAEPNLHRMIQQALRMCHIPEDSQVMLKDYFNGFNEFQAEEVSKPVHRERQIR